MQTYLERLSLDHEYNLLNLVTLDAGSWADWFSGIMTALAVITALIAYPVARAQRQNQELQRDKALGRAIGWKLLKVFNSTADIDRHITERLSKREALSSASMRFFLVEPLGIPERTFPELNLSETDFLLRAQAADLLAEIDMCIGRYVSIAHAMNEYKSRREALFELMPPPVASDGTIFTHELSQEQRDRVQPYAAMLESLLDGIIVLAHQNILRAKCAMAQYGKDMTRYFDKALIDFEADPSFGNGVNVD